MAISAFSGPIVSYGAESYADNNPEQGTSLFYAGIALLDPRSQFNYSPGQNFGSLTCGWLLTGAGIVSVYGTPMTLSTTKLTGAGAHITANTALPLITATTTGVAVGVSIPRSDTGVPVTGLLELDPLAMSSTANLTSGSNVLTVTAMGTGNGNNPMGINVGMALTDATTAANIPTGTTIAGFGTGNGGIGTYYMSANATATATGDTVTGLDTSFPPTEALGQVGTIQLYHPGAMLARAVSITSTTSQVAGIVFTVNGFDVFGFPMTETITTVGTSATTTSGKKAFKYIQSITPSATDGTGNYSAGTLDIFGFPIRSDNMQVGMIKDIQLMVNNATVTTATNWLAGVKTTATATTGDVRGTIAIQTPSNGTLYLGVSQAPSIAALQSSIGLYGVSQYAGF